MKSLNEFKNVKGTDVNILLHTRYLFIYKKKNNNSFFSLLFFGPFFFFLLNTHTKI